MINKRILVSCALFMLLFSCSIDDGGGVDIPLKDGSGKVVIEGYVTDEDGPYEIRVSKSLGITNGSNDYPVITNAKVVLTDNHGQTETLVYDATEKVYTTTNFHTKEGDTYTLSVTVDGKEYKATSTMPKLVEIDNVEQEKDPVTEGNILVSVGFTDPSTLGNRYVFRSQVGSKGKAVYNVFSDQLDNGEELSFSLLSNYFLKKNDTVVVEMRSVDTPIFDYFRVLPNSSADNPDGISIPANPVSNISNGALGYFSAHSVSTGYIIIQ